ncbi:hypothetical protein JKP88DRAFT_248671 [Tribonema minus]|uniref:Uncharacterized protein n=1 Tax=Tribonema minus TaxID=303371 RepID=A0A835YVB5_9STRA|nr:hypothetical protein JKP88DRAFT_248671 [Tribonema minus]
MIPFKKLLAYMANVLFFLPWIIMATPCSVTTYMVLLVMDTPRGPMFRQIGGTRKRANAIFAATIGRARKCRRPVPAQWRYAIRLTCTSTAKDPIAAPLLLRSVVLKALHEHVTAAVVRCMAHFARGAITAATALAAMRVIMPALNIKPLYMLAGVAAGQAVSSYKQYAHFGGGSTTRSHAYLLLPLLLLYMASLVSTAAGVAAAVIAAATDSSGSDHEVATDLHAEQLNAEQLRGQHPVPITAADHCHMEIQIQEALAEDLLMDTMDGEESDMVGSDVDSEDDDMDVEDSDEDASSRDNATPPPRSAAGGVAAIAARATRAVRNASARIMSFSIMGCNHEARKVKGGAVLAPQTSLINGDPAALISKSDKQKAEVQSRRNKSRESQQTFTFLENLLVKETVIGSSASRCNATRLRINNTYENAVGVDGPINLDINSYREETSTVKGVTVFGNRAPTTGAWFLITSVDPIMPAKGLARTVTAPSTGSERNDNGMASNVRTPTRTELLSLSDVLKRAEPEQGVMPLWEAWGIFLLQRACLVFEVMLVLHTYLTDSKVKKKSGSRLDANEWVRKGKYLRRNQPQLHSDGKRTHGIVRAIADSVTCDRLLPPTQHRYSHLDTSRSYLSLCWPGLTQQTISTLELERHPGKTASNVTPVNSVIKILSTAAVLGRLPTCASGAVMLTQDELELATSRIHATTVADHRQPFGVLETLAPPSHPSLPPALEALVCTEAGGKCAPACIFNSTPIARMEMWFLSADTNSGEAVRSPAAYNNLMSEAQFCRHTVRSMLKNSIECMYRGTASRSVTNCPYDKFEAIIIFDHGAFRGAKLKNIAGRLVAWF